MDLPWIAITSSLFKLREVPELRPQQWKQWKHVISYNLYTRFSRLEKLMYTVTCSLNLNGQNPGFRWIFFVNRQNHPAPHHIYLFDQALWDQTDRRRGRNCRMFPEVCSGASWSNGALPLYPLLWNPTPLQGFSLVAYSMYIGKSVGHILAPFISGNLIQLWKMVHL